MTNDTILILIVGAAVLANCVWQLHVRQQRIREEQRLRDWIDALPEPTMQQSVKLQVVANVIAALPEPQRTQTHDRFVKALCDSGAREFKPEVFCAACNVEWEE